MVRFAAYDDDGPAKGVPLLHAYLIGKEDLTIQGSIEFDSGVISCHRSTSEATGIALQIDIPVMGRLTVQTCLLPDAEEPYNLDLELARHRIMLLLNKFEQWSFSDLPADHPIMVGFEKARELFTKALIARGAPGDSSVAGKVQQAKLARQSLALGVEASERLAMLAAERDVLARIKPAGPSDASPADSSESTKAEPGKPKVGCALSSDRYAEPLQHIVQKNFDFVHSLTRWSEIEAEEGQRTFAPTDRWIEWAVRKAHLPVTGGPLIDLSHRGVPKWLGIWENDYKTLRELAYEHLKVVVTRYRRAISRWVAISGANANNEFGLKVEEMVDLSRLAVLTIRKLQPNATVLVEISEPFGEHVTHVDRSVSPILYAGILKESGIHFDGFAIRVQMGDGAPGRSSRDLMALSAMLDIYAEFEKPLHITAIGAPSAPYRAPEPGAKHRDLFGDPGFWRAPWSPVQQAQWMTQAMTIALSKPLVQSVCWQCLWDSDVLPEMRQGGLITSEGRAKPGLKRMNEICATLRNGRSPSALPQVEAGTPAPAAS
jgi:hypothetical protein